MSQLARLRRLLARRPWLYWAAVGAVALLIGLQVQAALAAVDHARRDWGTPVTVWVATAPAGRGDPILAEAREYPVAMVPAGALTGAPGGPAARAVETGEILLASAVGAGADVDPAAVVVAVPSSAAPRLVVGDLVTLFGNGAAVCDGTVTATGGDTTEVAVSPSCVATLAGHLLAGTVVVARHA